MHWMHLPLDHYRAHFSFSLLALTIASALPAYGGKFNPKFLENVQGIDQHVDLSVYDSPVGQQIPGKYRVFVFVNEEKWLPGRWILVLPAKHNAKPAASRLCLALAVFNWKKWACASTTFRH